MAVATIVHDTSEAVELCPSHGLYLKPISKMSISVALPQLQQPGKSISNWEVMERLKDMVHHHQFSTLRISKSTMDFIRFEGEVENKSLVESFLACLDGKTIKLSGSPDILKVHATEFKMDVPPTCGDWDFFLNAKERNETLPREWPDTIHLQGLPCKWFAQKESGSEKPSQEVLVKVFKKFGEIRNVDIPMLDPYREEMTSRNFHVFGFGGHLNFEAYIQYCEYGGFLQAMRALQGVKLMYKGKDGKAVACNIKVSFDSTKHLGEASIKKRQLERQKLQELEKQREQKRREKEVEERLRVKERKQKELEELERERKREEKLHKRQQKQRDFEFRRSQKQLEKLQVEEQKKLQKIKLEERKLLLVQRDLQSIRLLVELLRRAKAAKLQKQQQQEKLRQVEKVHKMQVQHLSTLQCKKPHDMQVHKDPQQPLDAAMLYPLGGPLPPRTSKEALPHMEVACTPRNVQNSIIDKVGCKEAHIPVCVGLEGDSLERRYPGVLACIPKGNQQAKDVPTCDHNVLNKEDRLKHVKSNWEPSKGHMQVTHNRSAEEEQHAPDRSWARTAARCEDLRLQGKEQQPCQKLSHRDQGSPWPRPQRSHSKGRHSRRERSRGCSHHHESNSQSASSHHRTRNK
ncbi:Splicing factor, arginine/serine-rich 17A [Heterocephalus glaber]|nr:A-kinase anchor protein 17A-like isoform X2 [Heterocephalus glaber]XP_021093578.1 A-kinase anchor protein 17A-like isoform X2 [Heterocephalus glaber]EHB11435.1 Splicing factor, arginine/serine-rich 17A [Heterocephalus glaber]